LAAILVGSRDHQTQFWKGAIQGPFHQSLVQIGPVASEWIKMWKVNGWTDDRRSMVTIAHMTLWVRWAKNTDTWWHYSFIKIHSIDANPFLVQSVTKSWDVSNLWFFSVIIIFHKILP
jgi:hypothetical protein